MRRKQAALICSWVDDHREDILRLTEDLIRFRSENLIHTGHEKECQQYVAQLMFEMGLKVDVFEPTAVSGLIEHEIYWPGRDYRARPNVVGVWPGTGNGQSLLFTSHADVVIGSDEGRFSPFEPAREANRLYGRGASDMKGGMAATIFAVKCLQALGQRLKGDVTIESIVDEENAGSNGTLASRLRGYQADAAICPEPNGMLISPTHRGGCIWEIIVEGKPGMPFGSDELVNPAFAVAHLAVAIESWEQERNQRTHTPTLFQKTPGLPVVLSKIKAESPVVGVPSRGQLEAWVEVYPGTTFEELRNDFIGHLEAVAAATPVLQKSKLDFRQLVRFLPGSAIPTEHPIIQVLERNYLLAVGTPGEVQGANFACDAYVFNQHSTTPCVILGPRGGNAHAPDEWVSIDDLISLTKIYALVALDWCEQSPDK